jgi:hypothetical protein
MSSTSRSWELIIQSAINGFDTIPELATKSRLIYSLVLWIQSLPTLNFRNRGGVRHL